MQSPGLLSLNGEGRELMERVSREDPGLCCCSLFKNLFLLSHGR